MVFHSAIEMVDHLEKTMVYGWALLMAEEKELGSEKNWVLYSVNLSGSG